MATGTRDNRRVDRAALDRAEQAAERSEQAAERVEQAADRVAEVIAAGAGPADGHAAPFVTTPVIDVPDELYDQIDALDDELTDLTAGGRRAWLELYQHVPPPVMRRSIAQLDNPGAGQLRNDLVRACQEAGKVGDLDLQLIAKAVFPGLHGACPKSREHSHIVRNVGHYGLTVLRNEAAITAAAALTGPSAPAAPAAVIDPIAAAEKMLEAGKRLTPTPAGPAQDPAAMATAILDVGQKLAAASSAQWQPVISLLTPVAGQLVQRLLSPPAPPDPIDALVKLRNAGLIPKAPGDGEGGGGMLDNVDTVIDLVDRLGDRLGRGGERPPALGVEAVRIIGPPMVRVLDRGVDAFNNWIQFRRERLYLEGGGAPRVPRRPPARPARPAPASVTGPTAAAQTAQAELVAVLQAATGWAQANDVARYPQLEAALVSRVPGCGDLLDDLRAGRLTELQAYDAMGQLGVEVLEPLAGYLRRFLAWARTQTTAAPAPVTTPAPPDAAPPAGAEPVVLGVVGRCERCGAEYNYRTRVELDTDESACDTAVDGAPCGGTIVAAEP